MISSSILSDSILGKLYFGESSELVDHPSVSRHWDMMTEEFGRLLWFDYFVFSPTALR